MAGKVLIFGADSFTGYHLREHLVDKGFEVYGTALLNSDLEGIIHCDITSINDIYDALNFVLPNYIINLAGITYVAEKNSLLMYHVNTIGAINILEAVITKNLNLKKLILVSSATVYGNQTAEVLSESMCPAPVNHYGCSKFAMERMAANYFDNLPIIITRPFNYTGEYQAERFLIPKIVKHFKERKKVIKLGNLDSEREFNDVKDICEIYRRLLLSDYSSGVVNICSGRSYSISNILKFMTEISGHIIDVESDASLIRKADSKRLVGCTERLFSIVGKYEFTPIESTLRNMYDSLVV
jgi:nucleoside-diphosphate-sugar epimerase